MEAHILWHVRHARNLDGSPTEHRDPGGELLIDDEFDDVKLIGVYSSERSAESAIARASLREGFRDEPECFYFGTYTVDEDHWTDGFVSIPAGQGD
ncbi:hypothetical protein G7075_03270 [Phycicoccus sp. HDW14]|uniref:DUF7336 domain-containing protein n=1 Tax=Phycicoccus sp. HDW14 TaxID=2714941 RepID=UPI00140D3DB1|nr:hypothetical protein [Phycicoccus sp. HDW14]QIM20394.1 hypothetical protein G7075_03270 [Phycicoccus sp. HDW14]